MLKEKIKACHKISHTTYAILGRFFSSSHGYDTPRHKFSDVLIIFGKTTSAFLWHPYVYHMGISFTFIILDRTASVKIPINENCFLDKWWTRVATINEFVYNRLQARCFSVFKTGITKLSCSFALLSANPSSSNFHQL